MSKTTIKINNAELIKKLEIVSILSQLPNNFKHHLNYELNSNDIRPLIGYASILSLSEEASDISLSYEIVARLIEYTKGKSQQVINASEIILSRIGNFPGRDLLRQRYNSETDFVFSPLKFETLAREAENTIAIDDEQTQVLTDFQYKFFQSLGNQKALSISAPTSAGKSFVLNLDLVRQVSLRKGQSIVYIVPTRALITEVSNRIRHTLRAAKLEEIPVRTAPFPLNPEKIDQAIVYVLTQERLMSFINSRDEKPYISSLIVDEAHEIQNGKRGIVLQNAIDIAISRFTDTKILFASPLIKNPAYFLTLFNKTDNGEFFVETVSPVSQNLLLVSEVKGKPKAINLSLLSRQEEIEIGNIEIDFRFRDGITEQRANLALSIGGSDEAVISFSNNPSGAENTALKIAENIVDFIPCHELLSFVDFLKAEIHPEYSLVDCLLKGIAFHYGSMPSLVRSGVEELFKKGIVKIICCTSTLLQGVNLPAKHVIINNPKSGDAPMSRADFLNLAGRAGRLLQEFHGNIWCIRPKEWKSECYQGEPLQEIQSAMSKVMDDGGSSIHELIEDSNSDNKNLEEAEAAFGKFYHDYVQDPELGFVEKYRNDENSTNIDKTIKLVSNIKVTLPLEILESHQALRPDHLQALYEFLQEQQDLESLCPMSPYSSGAKDRMEAIFKIVINKFEWEEVSPAYMGWISFLAYMWVWGKSMGEILSTRVNFIRKKKSDETATSIIRSCLQVLENAVRFKLVKYFAAYIDILTHVALERGEDNIAESIEPYHIYLEFGSCDRRALSLMALGISRFTALHLKKFFEANDELEAEEYLDRLSQWNIDNIKMPQICIQEIRQLLGYTV